MMQTFLPYPDFAESAACLDRKRCFSQLREATQILNTLLGLSNGWKNHPAVRMWRGHERALAEYRETFYKENASRGIRFKLIQPLEATYFNKELILPTWLGNADFHASHRSNLLRKNFEYYGKFGWTEKDDLPYIWPL